MKESFRKLKFKGKKYLLITDSLDKKDGAIATEEQYREGHASFAHLNKEGNINRYGKLIGNINDIEFGDIEEIEIDIIESFEKCQKNFIEKREGWGGCGARK